MTNIELETKIKELIAIENYFDMIEAVNAFEKEYKSTGFYKTTKKPLIEVMREARVHYALQLQDLTEKIQSMINDLSLEKVQDLLNQLGDVFTQENTEVQDSLKILKDIMEK